MTIEVDTPLAAALAYARLGWWALPAYVARPDGGCSCQRGSACPTPGKHPVAAWKGRPTAPSAEELAALWQRHPDANVCVITGRRSGLLVADVDPRHAGDPQTLTTAGWPAATPTVLTGGGGHHRYVAAPTDAWRVVADPKYQPGIELKGDGNIVIAPPSVHVSGRRYAWAEGLAPWDVALGIPPPDVFGRYIIMTEPPQLPRRELAPLSGAQSQAQRLLERAIGKAHQEGRNNAGHWLACQLRDLGCDLAQGWAVMAQYQGTVCSLGPDAPYDEAEALATWTAVAPQEPRDPPQRPPGALPYIRTTNTPLRDLVDQAQQALEARQATRADMDQVYVKDGVLTVVIAEEADRAGRVRLARLGSGLLRAELSRAADFKQYTRTADSQTFTTHVDPPHSVVRALAETLDWHLRPLRGVTSSPIVRPDGTLFSDVNCYDPGAKLLYCPPPGFVLPDIPAAPTAEDCAAALAALREVFCDFPFTTDASRDHVLALVLTPILRPVIDDVKPVAAITAPDMGTGKTLLTDAALLLATGEVPAGESNPDETELRKDAVTKLREGRQVILYDNVDGGLHSTFLEGALTRRYVDLRLLGKHELLEVFNDATWVINGNNLRLLRGLARRHYLIRINADTEEPWARTTFTHDPLLNWVRAERPRLLAAAYTLVRAWFVAGCPPPPTARVLASFERWSQVVGGVLWHAGARAFLADRDEVIKQADPGRGDWAVWRRCLYDALGGKSFRANTVYDRYLTFTEPPQPRGLMLDLNTRAETVEQRIRLGMTTPVYDYLPEELQAFTNVKGRFTRRLGQELRDQINSVRGGLRLELSVADSARGNEYRLVEVAPRERGG